MDVQAILAAFGKDSTHFSIQPFGNGHIHSTYLIEGKTKNEGKWILQRINQQVFPNPKQVMENITLIGQHLAQVPNYPLLNLQPIQTLEREAYYLDEHGGYWRIFPFFEHTITFGKVAEPAVAYEAAKAFGHFSLALFNFPIDQLHETIVGFHNSISRFQAFTKALETGLSDRILKSQAAIAFILERASIFETIVALKLPIRATHNDTKLDNVLLDATTHRGVCVIDLDTVMPGIILSDFGDMVRTFTNTEAEDSDQYHAIQVNWQVYEALCKGFLEVVGKALIKPEIDHLVLGAKWMILEQAMRFLTDYLLGDTYYKVHHTEHNFVRTYNQIALLQSIENQEQAMIEVVKNCLK